jgi:hypothetical protein
MEKTMARKSLRKLIGATIGIFIALLTNVANAATNYTDMWFNPSESGWGVNFTQDYNGPIFATFFVYAANGAPTWVVGLLALDPTSGVYSGTLSETSGGAPLTSQSFNPAAVQVSNVGTASFTPKDAANGTLAYTYRGSAVAKQITREPLYTADTAFNATFLTLTSAGTAYRAIFESRNNGQCSATDPPHQTLGATWRIFPTAVTSSSISFNVGDCDANSPAAQCVISTPFCSFTGSFIQSGRLSSVSGTLNCTVGHAFFGGLTGAFTATFYEIEHTDAGVNGKLFVTNGSCNVQSIVLIQRNNWLNGQLP